MFEIKPGRDDERMDIFNRMFQPVNELWDQGVSTIDSKLANFKADVKKVNNKYLVEAELPGYKKDEISVDYDHSYLTIRAEKETNDEVKEKGKIIRRERHTGQAVRRFYVSGVDKDEIRAELNDGILKIEMPIKESEEAYSKRIEIL
ncbi:MAG TPA: Hsp20/alpha crystallin family protein [Pseudogracilibacillus sp.]|nr:Hsp20/alpha crystallin family protein [Pseudogracilibacillus sp.]